MLAQLGIFMMDMKYMMIDHKENLDCCRSHWDLEMTIEIQSFICEDVVQAAFLRYSTLRAQTINFVSCVFNQLALDRLHLHQSVWSWTLDHSLHTTESLVEALSHPDRSH